MEITAEKIWQEYENGKDYLNKYNYYTNTEDCARYYNGDQWHGLKTGGEKMPQLNIIKPIVSYKVSTVNSNGYAINYQPMGYDMKYISDMQVCDRLNTFALTEWERLKYDTKLWKHTTRAAVTGDSYVYFFWDVDKNQLIDQTIPNTNIFFSDEQETDIQKQKYIIISERVFVSQIKEIAKENNIKSDDIALINSDKDTAKEIGEKAKQEIEQNDHDGKCILLTRIWKQDGIVHYCKSVKDIVVVPDTPIKGLDVYPIAHIRWDEEIGSGRGIGEVLHLIPNQDEINKSLARHAIMIKMFAFPKTIYNKQKLNRDAISNLSKVGSSIGIDGNVTDVVSNYVSYLSPPQMPSNSLGLSEQLITTTRELAGASDAATGQVNPENASGTAITAVQDAQALPLSMQKANLTQFVEDIARIWISMWVAYNPNGMTIGIKDKLKPIDENGQELAPIEAMVGLDIPPELLSNLDLAVKVDISPKNPYSKYSQEQNLMNFMTSGLISFEDFIDALDDDSAIPKTKIKQIITKQKEMQQQQLEQQQEQVAAEQMAMEEQNSQNTTMTQLLDENTKLKEALNGAE